MIYFFSGKGTKLVRLSVGIFAIDDMYLVRHRCCFRMNGVHVIGSGFAPCSETSQKAFPVFNNRFNHDISRYFRKRFYLTKCAHLDFFPDENANLANFLVRFTMKQEDPSAENRITMLDRYLRICSDMYLLNMSPSVEERFRTLVSEPRAARDAIALLKSQYRKSEVLDGWTSVDIALFVAGITRFGRDWESVKSILPHKSAPELSQFYYSVWKGSRMYLNWKRIRKQRGLE